MRLNDWKREAEEYRDIDREAQRKAEATMTNWVYIQSEPGLLTVGFYDPKGKWHPDSDHTTREAAAARVSYLNGGQS